MLRSRTHSRRRTTVLSTRAECARTQKHGKYDKEFLKSAYSFCAMVWETLGAIRFAARQLNREFSSFCGRAFARISCCLQRAVSQAILVRISGLEFQDFTPTAP